MKTQYKSVYAALDDELQRVMSPQAHTFVLQSWYRYMFPMIPFDTGTLASLASVGNPMTSDEAMHKGLEDIKDNIHFKAPYASRMYSGSGFNFKKDQHPLAQAYWGEMAWDIYGNQIADELKRYLKGEIK